MTTQDGHGPTGAELRAYRKTAGLTQTALARLAGCQPGAVAYWERAPRLDVRSDLVVRLTRLVGMYDHASCTCPGGRARWSLTPEVD